MKRKRIVTAAILSAGLILGATSTAFAVDPTPIATITTVTYNSQLAAYNASLTALDSAGATFKIQMATYTTAVQVYKTSYSTATTASSAATATYKAALNVYQSAVASYNTSYKSVLQGYKTLVAMREQLKKSIGVDFDTAVRNTNAAFATAMSAATTDAQKSAATSARQSAIATAIATRKTALDALGAKIVKPGRVEAKNNVKENTFKFDRPVRPVRPAHADKSRK